MTIESSQAAWATAAVLIGRLIFASVFILAVSFKLMDIDATVGYIASAGFPMAKLLAWLAAVLELALVACFLTGAYFSEAALLAAAYVLFLGLRCKRGFSGTCKDSKSVGIRVPAVRFRRSSRYWAIGHGRTRAEAHKCELDAAPPGGTK